MIDPFFDTSIEYLNGVGPQRASLLKKELNITVVRDLINHFPFRYVDKSVFHAIQDIPHLDQPVQLKVKLIRLEEKGVGRKLRLVAKVEDDSGELELIWFKGVKWVKPKLNIGSKYVIYGKATKFNNRYNISHPDFQLIDTSFAPIGMQSVYSTTEKLSSKGLHSKGLEKIIHGLLPQFLNRFPENIPGSILSQFNLMEREKAFKLIHKPTSEAEAAKARFRIKFEELMMIQLELLMTKKLVQKKYKGHVINEVGKDFNEFFANYIPFELTNAQKRVVKEIRRDMALGAQMNRLLQGDVGSGKTLVALLVMLMITGNQLQAALIAPTEILAQQHMESLTELCSQMNLNIKLLTGSVKKKDRKPIHEGLLDGSINILIGTHALLEDTVQFQNLGLVVIDEQHRFGVAQRAKLWRKNATPPHILVMTATPIPRTLAMTFYGDLDVSIIDELPPGRKSVKTIHQYEQSRLKLFGFIEDQIALGRQIYIVYPLIEESEKLDLKNLTQGFEVIERRFPKPKYQVSIVHGKMTPEAKEFEMQQFVKGHTNIMVATTVIEVGVNVPNASVMIIENANRFGLSQLHQLRGRVGRGAEQSYCVLMTDHKLTADGKTRIETMVRTNDGFEIAEVDLKLRGPGDLMGTQQSGMLDLKLADLAKDQAILAAARNAAVQILEQDPSLKAVENRQLALELMYKMKHRKNWSRIS